MRAVSRWVTGCPGRPAPSSSRTHLPWLPPASRGVRGLSPTIREQRPPQAGLPHERGAGAGGGGGPPPPHALGRLWGPSATLLSRPAPLLPQPGRAAVRAGPLPALPRPPRLWHRPPGGLLMRPNRLSYGCPAAGGGQRGETGAGHPSP